MRPRPFGVKRPQDRFVLCNQAKRLDENRCPTRRPCGSRTRLDQLADVERARERHERHAHRGAHEVDNETTRQWDFSNRTAHRSTQAPATIGLCELDYPLASLRLARTNAPQARSFLR